MDVSLGGLPLHVLVAIQDNLRGKRWMATDLDCDVSPLAVQDMEGEVIDIRVRLFSLDVPAVENFKDRRLRSPDKDQKQAFLNVCLREVLASDLMLVFSRAAAPNGNPVGHCPAAESAMKAS